MPFVGLDIGSRSTKLVVLGDDGDLESFRVVDTTYEPLEVCRGLLDGVRRDRLALTGYGRHLAKEAFPEAEVITEIKAAALGARRLSPQTRTVLDVGGQDTKAIALDGHGRVRKFAMNDRCAAGTGRFLEVMATALSLSRRQFIAAAARAESSVALSSMCAVFAESEVISLTARNAGRDRIARGIHEAVATRVVSLLKRVPLEAPVLFAGGGALNHVLVELAEAGLGVRLTVPEEPQIVAALGCAAHASGSATEKETHP